MIRPRAPLPALAGLLALTLLGACRVVESPAAPTAPPPTTGTVEGMVRSPDGAPVAGAFLAVRGEDDSRALFVDPRWWLPMEPSEGVHPGTTGPDGRFRIEGLVLGASYFVVATATGWTSAEPIRRLLVDEQRPVVVADPVLRRGGQLEISLLDPRGAPVIGATVTHHILAERRPWEQEVREGLDPGVFRLESLPPHTIFLTVEAEGWAERSLRYEMGEGESKREVVRLDPGATLRGRIVDEKGDPVPDGCASLSPAEYVWPYFQRQPVNTGRDGSFEFRHLPAGSYVVSGSAYSGGETEAVRAVVPGEDLVLRISARPGRVRFRLRAPEGFATPKELPSSKGTYNWREGSFVVEVNSPESGVLRFFPPGFAPLALEYTVAAGGTVDLGEHVLDPGVSFEGRVVDPAGRPVEMASVQIVQRWSRADPRTTTGPDGAFRLEHLARGSNELHLSKDGFLPRRVEVTGEGGGPRVFVLARGGLLRVRVRDAEGGPMAGAWVKATPVGGDPAVETWQGGTDARGRAEVRLAAGTWRVEAGTWKVEGWNARPGSVTLVEGETAEVTLDGR
jgi:hypothetical protein